MENIKNKRIFTEEHKRRLSAALKGRTLPKETRQKMSIAAFGKKRVFTEKHKQNLSIAMKNMSDNTKRKLSIALTGRKVSNEARLNMSLAQSKHVRECNKKNCRTIGCNTKLRGGGYKGEPSKLAHIAYDKLLKDFEIVIAEERFHPYTVDFLLAEEWIAFEIDGEYWHKDSKEKDKLRDKYLYERYNLPVVRLTQQEILEY